LASAAATATNVVIVALIIFALDEAWLSGKFACHLNHNLLLLIILPLLAVGSQLAIQISEFPGLYAKCQ
jgi:hypothetical protein